MRGIEVVGRLAVVAVLALALLLPARDRGATGPLTESELERLVKRSTNREVLAQIESRGIGFAVNSGTLSRLREAGASEAVLKAVARAPRAAAGGASESTRASTQRKRKDDEPPKVIVAFDDVLRMLQEKKSEKDIIDKLDEFPTYYTLDDNQVRRLRAAGASDELIKELRRMRMKLEPDVAHYAIILDLSGSMNDKTKDRVTKLDAAKRVIIELIRDLPNGKYLTFVVYGHYFFRRNKKKSCEAVQVVLERRELTDEVKDKLAKLILGLQAKGETPISLALRKTAEVLTRKEEQCELVLLTDGMENCGGNPAFEAAELNRKLALRDGVNVIGFDVTGREKGEVIKIAEGGGGEYYDASDARALAKVGKKLAARRQKTLAFNKLVKARGLPEAPRVRVALGANLIANPDAEAAPGAERDGDLVDAPGWRRKGNATVLRYGAVGDQPRPDSPGPRERGKNFFSGGPNNALSELSQEVNVTVLSGKIDTGKLAYELSAYLGGFASQEDHAVLAVDFLDADGKKLASAQVGPVTARERKGTTGHQRCARTGKVPAGTRKLSYRLTFTRFEGSYNDGSADNLSLVFKEAPEVAEVKPPEGFKALFNGKDLAGWTRYRCAPDDWGIDKDGATLFVAKPSTQRTGGWLVTEKEYDNFELRLEFRLPRGANSGVVLRAPLKDDLSWTGMEVQILDDPTARKDQRVGSIFDVIPSSSQPLKPEGEWNRYRIVCRERRVTVELNDEKVLDANLDDHAKRALEHPGIVRERGHIGLQQLSGRVEFRNVFLKELPPDPNAWRTALVWSLDRLPRDFQASAVAISADEKRLAVGGRHGLALWDLSESRKLADLSGSVHSLTFSPDSKVLAVGGDRAADIRLVDAQTGELRKTNVFKGPDSVVTHIAFADGGKLLAAAFANSSFGVWDALTQEQVWLSPETKGTRALGRRFSGNGNLLADWRQGEREVRFWDLAGEPRLKAKLPLKDPTGGSFFTPDGKQVMVTEGKGTMHFWSTTTWKEQGTIEDPTSGGQVIAFSRDSKTLALTQGGEVHVWDLKTWKKTLTVRGEREGPIRVGSYYTRQNWLFTRGANDPHLMLRDGATGKLLAPLPINFSESGESASPVLSVLPFLTYASKDDSFFAVVSKEGVVKVYRLANLLGKYVGR
jgi:WD40 repeat protein/Mg-chelatase subunit ChlD